jgi:hypothetical protein
MEKKKQKKLKRFYFFVFGEGYCEIFYLKKEYSNLNNYLGERPNPTNVLLKYENTNFEV